LRLLLLVLLAGAAYVIYLKMAPAPPPSSPPKAVVPGGQPSKPVGSPEPDFLVTHAKDIGLSPEQVDKLSKQKAEFEKTAAPVRKKLDEAGAEVAHELNKLSGEKVKVPDVQERTHLLNELSGEMAKLREGAWKEEQKILTPEQRQKALDEWAKVHQLFPGGSQPAKPETPGQKSKSAAPSGGG
jgi:hypothetical protein